MNKLLLNNLLLKITYIALKRVSKSLKRLIFKLKIKINVNSRARLLI